MDQLDLLNELHLMQNQMNTMFKTMMPKKANKDLLDAHNKAIESRKTKHSDDGTTPNFGKKYLESQEKTNTYLDRLIKTTQQTQFKRENTTINPLNDNRSFSANPLNIMKNLGGFLEKDNNKGLTSALLKLPAGLLNFGKDILSKKEIKKINTGRQDLSVNKEILESRRKQLSDLKKKHKEENPSGVENLEHKKKEQDLESKIENQKQKVKLSARELSVNSEKLQNKNDLKLNRNKFKNINKTDVEDIRSNNRKKMEESLLTDLEPKIKTNKKSLTVDTQKVRSGPIDSRNSININREVPKQSRLEDFENIIKTLKGVNVDTSIDKKQQSSILKQKVNVGPGTPSTFGDVVGGIYYRLGTIIENSGKKPESKEGGSSGILGMLGGLLGLVGSFLMAKFLPLGKMFSKLLGSAGILSKVFTTMGKPLTKILEKVGLKTASKAIVKTGVKIAAEGGVKGVGKISGKISGKIASKEALKVGGKEALKVGGKEALKVGGKGLLKTAAKKIPLVGAAVGALFAAQRAMGGDFKGAGLELASGATSFLPGVGTVAGLGIDAYLAKRDYDKSMKGTSQNKPSTTPPQPRERISPTLQTDSEVIRTKNNTENARMLEDAVYLGMKRYIKEDLVDNEPQRAKIYADANLNVGM